MQPDFSATRLHGGEGRDSNTRYLWQDYERAAVESKLRAAIVGSGCEGEGSAGEVVANTAADGVIVVTDAYEHADRIESYPLSTLR